MVKIPVHFQLSALRGKQMVVYYRQKHVTESGSGSLKSVKLITKYDQHRDYSLGGVLASGIVWKCLDH